MGAVLKYHNSTSGPQVCKAHVRECPIGGEHFQSQADAFEAFEQEMNSTHGTFARVKKATLGRLGLKKVNRPELTSIAQAQRKQARKKKAAKIAIIAASMAMLSACAMDGDSSRWAEDQPQESYSASQTAGDDVKPTVNKDKPAPDADEDSMQDKFKDYQDQAQDKLDELKDTYGDDWKDNLVEGLDEFLDYAEDYEEPLPDPTESHGEYDRDAFKHWTDTSLFQNNCDTRQDILERDLDNVVLGSDGCILSGTLQDPYTGETINYERGDLSIDIDHVFSLGDSWDKGSNNWSDAKREAFANDPENLLAVQAGANRSKSDNSPSEWMPIDKDSACAMGVKYLQIGKKYDLRIDQEDVASVNEACK